MGNFYEFRVRRIRRSRAAEPRPCNDPAAAAGIFAYMLEDEPREVFVCASLDAKNRVIGVEQVAIGTMTGVDLHPREIFRTALLAGAVGIVIGHNHPSGDPTPSEEDRRLTQRLVECGQLLGIPVLDHIVVGELGAYYSFSDKGEL